MELKHLFAAAAIAAVPFAAQAELKPMQTQELRAVEGQGVIGVNVLTAIDNLVNLGELDEAELLDNLVDLGAIDSAYDAEGPLKSAIDELIDLGELDAFEPVDDSLSLGNIDERIDLADLANLDDVVVEKRISQLNNRAERRDNAAAFLRGLGTNPELYSTLTGATIGAVLEAKADFAQRRATFLGNTFSD